MQLTTSIIAYLLRRRLNLPERISFSSERNVDSVCLLTQQPVQSNGLYIVPPEQLSQLSTVTGQASCLVLSDSLPGSFTAWNICQISRPLPDMDWNQSALVLLQTVAQIILEHLRWEQTFIQLNTEKADISAYFSAIRSFYNGTLLLIDRDSEILAGSVQNAAEYFGNSDGSIPGDQLVDVMLGTEFQANCNRTGFFDIQSLTGQAQYIGYNFLKNGSYLGCLSLCGCCCTDVEPGELALLKEIAEILEPPMFVHIEMRYALSKNGDIHRLLSEIVEQPEEKGAECQELAEILGAYGWREGEQLCTITLRFFDGISADFSGSYVCTLLEERWRHSFAVVSGDYIYWVINCTKHALREAEEDFQRMIVSTVSSYICQAGISYFFSGVQHLPAYICQAQTALHLGQKEAPHQWYHLFAHYALEDMVGHLTRKFCTEYVAHRGLLRLASYDRSHQTSYIKTLRVYLANDKNVSRAAQELFLHRTSLNRQLERIRQIMGCELSGTYEDDLYLRLSLLLLEADRKKRRPE